jgi:hypothetical protein
MQRLNQRRRIREGDALAAFKATKSTTRVCGANDGVNSRNRNKPDGAGYSPDIGDVEMPRYRRTEL